MDTIIYTAQVTSIGGRTGHIRSSDRALNLDMVVADNFSDAREPAGTNPEQLFAGAYASCFETTLIAVAEHENIVVNNSSVTARIHLIKNTNGYHIKAELDVSLPGFSEVTGTELIEKAHRQCPYSKAIKGNVGVKTVLL